MIARSNGPPRTGRDAGRTRRSRLLLAAGSGLLALAAAELGLRLRAAAAWRAGLEQLSRDAVFVEPADREVALGDIIRPSLRPEVVYELIPDTRTEFLGKRLHVNSAGFRGPLVPEPKPAGTVRILGLGDSVMFGWGVHDEETYLAVLEARLRERHPAVRWEVINTAVPGYNTAMEAATLAARGLAYRPDLVLVGYVSNDLLLPNFLLSQEDPWSLSESFVAELVAGRSRSAGGLVPRPYKGKDPDSERVPDAYRYMVGVDGYRTAMSEIVAMGERHGFGLLVLSELELEVEKQAAVREIREQLEVPLVSPAEVTRRYLRERGLRAASRAGLTVSATDPHPSALGHELMATALLEYLEHSEGFARWIAGGGR